MSRVFNPRQALGWAPKEGSTEQDLARLKIEGPATLRTRERAIATIDFEFLATQFVDTNGSNLVARAKAIEETLRESEDFNRAVVENSPLGISVRNSKGKLLSVNNSWKKIWGVSEKTTKKYTSSAPEKLTFDQSKLNLKIQYM